MVTRELGLVTRELGHLGDGEADGDRVVVPYDAETVKAAPVASGDELTEDEFEAVYDHYGISDATQRDQSHP